MECSYDSSSSIASISSSSPSRSMNEMSPQYMEVFEDFRKQALNFYGSESSEGNKLSHDVERCLAKRVSSLFKGDQKKLFLFPCINDLSNIPDEDLDEDVSDHPLLPILSMRKISDFSVTSSERINDLSVIISTKSKNSLYLKNQSNE